MIEKTILAEENRFDAVLTDGLPRLEAEIAKVLGTEARVLAGDAAFRLYDTFGVPVRLHRGHGRDARSDRRQSRLRARDGGPARQGAREERLQGAATSPPGSSRTAPSSTPRTTPFDGYATTRTAGVPIVAFSTTTSGGR